MQIKFSHNYKKLRGLKNGDKVKLLQVIDVKLEHLSNSFLMYDTGGVYKLPKRGNYLMLIFEKGLGDIFTTLRRWTDTKAKYYRTMEGRFLEILIQPSDEQI